MINQQLVDFIKQQLQAGLTKEKISSDLLANGWNSQDIEEGFTATNVPTLIPPSTPISSYGDRNTYVTSVKPKTHYGKKILIILIILLLVGGASAYYFKDNLLNSSIIKDTIPNPNGIVLDNTVDTSQTVPQPEVPVQNPAPTNDTSTVTPTEQPTVPVPTPTPIPTPIPATQPVTVTTNAPSGSARDATAKKDLKKAAVVAEPYWDKASSYAGFCTSSEYVNVMKDIVAPTTLNCKDNTDEYSITASMSGGGYWCVDNYLYNNKSSLNTGTSCVK